MAICSTVEFGAHAGPQAKVPIVGTVESWQDERRSGPTNECIGRNPAGREVVAEAEVASLAGLYGGRGGYRQDGKQDRLHGCKEYSMKTKVEISDEKDLSGMGRYICSATQDRGQWDESAKEYQERLGGIYYKRETNRLRDTHRSSSIGVNV